VDGVADAVDDLVKPLSVRRVFGDRPIEGERTALNSRKAERGCVSSSAFAAAYVNVVKFKQIWCTVTRSCPKQQEGG
jgi:hypothetical protein